MSGELPAALQGHFFPPTEEQKAQGWSQNWPLYWKPHDEFLRSGGHPPTAEQAAKGWSQNWDKWKIAEDEELLNEKGEKTGGTLVRIDFTAGATARAAKQQMSKETHEFQLKEIKGASSWHTLQLHPRADVKLLQSCVRSWASAARRRRTSRLCC